MLEKQFSTLFMLS